MTSITFQVQLGFLLAVSRSPGDRVDIAHGEFPNRPCKPLPLPPTGYSRYPNNVKDHRHLSRDHLLRAQWAIDQLETALYANNLTTANNQRGLKVKNELESWTVEYDGLINQYQCNQYEWIGLKLKSPLFRPESFIADADSKTVMDIVTKKFLTVPNSETRLVVKVFIPKHLASLGAMNAIASMLWLVDPLLNDIHPAHCGPNSLYSLGLQYTNLVNDDANDLQAELLSAVEVEDPWNNRLSPNRRPLELLPHPGELGEAKYSHGVHRILGANSVQDLIHLMDVAIYGEAEDHPYARPAYCFVDNKSTVAVEFNQHCGTLDMLDFSLGYLLRKAHSTLSRQIRYLLLRIISRSQIWLYNFRLP
jgi:hypothetical protein